MTPKQIELLLVAKREARTARRNAEEKDYRSACNRAYYAMFHIATAFVLEKGLEFSKHSAVISAFGQRVVLEEGLPREYHKILSAAFERRNIADYDVMVSITKEDAIELVNYAERFVELANERLGDVSDEDEDV